MSAPTTSAWRSPHLLWATCLVGSTLGKLLSLRSRSLWLDETYSLYGASLPFHQLWFFSAGDVHPRAFVLLLWAWVRLIGETTARLRLFSVVVNFASVIAFFFLAKRLLGSRAGSFAAVLYAFSPTLFIYSLEVRSYMLLLLATVCLLQIHWIVAVEQDASRARVVLYSVLAASLIYIHYLGLLVLAALFVHWLTLSRLRWSRLSRAFVIAGLTLLFAGPAIPLLLSQRAGKHQLDRDLLESHMNPQALSYAPPHHIVPPSRTLAFQVVQDVAACAGVFPARSTLLLAICAIPFLLVFAAAAYLWFSHGDEVCHFAGVVGVVFLAGTVAGGFSNHRYYLTLIPLLILAVARAVQRWPWPFPRPGASLTLGAAILALYVAGFVRQAIMPHGHPWQDVVQQIQHRSAPGDIVVFNAVWAQVPFDYFARQQKLQLEETGFPESIYTWWSQQPFRGWGGPVLTRSELAHFAQQLDASRAPNCWLVLFESAYYDPHDALLQQLSHMGQLTEIPLPADPDRRTADAPSVRLFQLSRRPTADAPAPPAQIGRSVRTEEH